MENKTYLFFDVETTGIINYKVDLLDPSQPHIVQLAAILTDDAGKILQKMNVIINHEGLEVPQEVVKIHGITTEICQKKGIPMIAALGMFEGMKEKCTARAAYNINFDKRMIAREEGACGLEHKNSADIETICVMEMARAYAKLAPTDKMMAAGIRQNKAPKLKEAYRLLFDKELENAHDAMADVRACKDIFFAIKKLNKETA